MAYLQFIREAIYPLVVAICLSVAVIGVAIFAVTGETIALVVSGIYALGAATAAIMPDDSAGRST